MAAENLFVRWLRANDDHLIKHATKSTTSRGFFEEVHGEAGKARENPAEFAGCG